MNGKKMPKHYLTSNDLRKIKIDEIMGDNAHYNVCKADDNFFIDDADIFRQGVCQIFAYELNAKYGYPIFKIENGHGIHIFCKSAEGNKYIDIRGITECYETFAEGLFMTCPDVDNSILYDFSEKDLDEEYVDIMREFAQEIIKRNENLYTL